MQVTTTISYNVKWPSELVKDAKFAHGTPEVGNRILKRVGAKIVRGIKDNIKLSRGVRGGKLAPLKPSTIAKKRSKGYANPSTPLRAKNILYNAIKYYSTGQGAGKVSIARRGKPNRREVAEWQQKGSYGGPRRAFFGINPQMRKDIDSLIRNEFRVMMRRSTTIAQGIARGGKAFGALD